ncbi:MAG TPA: hypothetical protein VJ552_05760 [Sediminibacterium sp.]|nr:hypothetical protein [Sediminibacterium sp.]
MQRVGTLINKLKDQFEQQADPEKLAQTAQLILAELQTKRTAELVTGGVSVQLPAVVVKMSCSEAPVIPESMPAYIPPVKPTPKKEDLSGWLFDTPVEIPTLVHQDYNLSEAPVPLNEAIGTKRTELNDHLKEERVEVAAKLEETPIRDLRKAISVNDRYLFTHTLFRGDENMYERSIKTINGFTIYPEAQYWIQRELKVKLGWPENHEAVKLFDHLIRRRFS